MPGKLLLGNYKNKKHIYNYKPYNGKFLRYNNFAYVDLLATLKF